MSSFGYQSPVSRLLDIGEASSRRGCSWPDYPGQYGLTAVDVPALLQMACDPELNTADSESAEVWAPLHAARALGQLQAAETASRLLHLLDDYPDDDWFHEDLPQILGLMGGDAMPAARDVLERTHHHLFFTRIAAARALVQIAGTDETCYPECVAAFVAELERDDVSEGREEWNAWLVVSLLDLKAVETLPLIRRLFADDRIDQFIINWKSVQREFDIGEPDPSPPDPFDSRPDFMRPPWRLSEPRPFERTQPAPLTPEELRKKERKKKNRYRKLKNRARKLAQRKRR